MDAKKAAEEQAKKLAEQVGIPVGTLIQYAIIALVVVVVLFILWKLLKGRRKGVAEAPDLKIDVMGLGAAPPPATGPQLTYLNVPVRLAAIVLAPAGRVRELPPLNQLDDIIDAIVPGLSAVVKAHKRLYRKWPPQMSTRGFAHTFFGQAKLPGEGGKGSPWSSAAGIFKIEGQPLMAGLVLRAKDPSNLGQKIVEEESQWLDLLRIKGE
jgi:hypothetical protein